MVMPWASVFQEDVTAAYIFISHAAENCSLVISLIFSFTLPDDGGGIGIFGLMFNQKTFPENVIDFPKSYRQVIL